MLKIKSGKNVLLGVDKENIKRLTNGHPIRVKGTDLGIDNDIFIVYGETLKNIQDELNIPGVQ